MPKYTLAVELEPIEWKRQSKDVVRSEIYRQLADQVESLAKDIDKSTQTPRKTEEAKPKGKSADKLQRLEH